MTKPARLNGSRHDEVPILPTLPGFPGSVMAIVSLLTSAAKLSLVTESAGRAKRCPRRPADAAADMTRLDEQLVQVQRARLIAGEPVEAQNNMGRRVGSRGKEMVTRGAPRPTALLP